MKKIIKIISLVMTFAMMYSLSSCGKSDYTSSSIYYATIDDIKTYDPQLANSSAELTLVKNCFEGLMTTNKDGKLIKGCAKSYTISSDELQYSFVLKSGLLWQDGETNVTAKDFEFAITRAILPETKSPYVSKLFSIKNAKKINLGKADLSSLGIETSNNSITFTLSQPDKSFLSTLSKAICMPCNEEFFNNTHGKYGLEIESILCNGSYFISSTSTKSIAVTLARNENYKGDNVGIASYLSITYQSKQDSIEDMLDNNNIDIGAIDCSLASSFANENKDNKLFYNTNYVLYISPKLKNSDGISLAKALMLDINTSTITSNLSENYCLAKGIIPNTNDINGENYRQVKQEITNFNYNLKKATSSLGDYTNSNETLSGLSLYYPKDSEKISLIANIIAQGWQKDLNAYINTKDESSENILSRIKSNEYQIAIIPISSLDNSAYSSYCVLSDNKISSKINITNIKKAINKIYSNEKSLVNNNIIYPLLSIPTCYCFAENIKDISFSDSGNVIDFRYAKKP